MGMMFKRSSSRIFLITMVITATVFLISTPLQAAKVLKVYTDIPAVHEAEQWVAAAEKGIGMKIQWSPKFSSNELWTRVQSEAPNFNADMIWGFMNAHAIIGKEMGYFIPYKSPTWAGIPDRFKDPDGHWYGIDYWFAPWVANKNLLEAKKLPVPKSWKDLLNPAYKGEIVMPNPGTSGTAFLHISTVMMIYGEKKGWEYLDKLNKNVAQYTKSGTAPAQLVATGEYAIGLSWDMAVYGRAEKGFPIIPIIPSEGVGANLDSIAILKGCKNLEGAKKLVDWSGTVEGQTVFGTTRAKVTRPGVPSLAKIKPKLIVYDAKWAGENQKRIMAEWKNRFQK